MDTSLIRLLSQIALVGWCVAEGIVLILSRGHATQVSGVRVAIAGLVCFAGWMFLSALSIQDTAIFPRESMLWTFALLEAGTAVSAWGWLVVNIKQSFRLTLRKNANGF